MPKQSSEKSSDPVLQKMLEERGDLYLTAMKFRIELRFANERLQKQKKKIAEYRRTHKKSTST